MLGNERVLEHLGVSGLTPRKALSGEMLRCADVYDCFWGFSLSLGLFWSPLQEKAGT